MFDGITVSAFASLISQNRDQLLYDNRDSSSPLFCGYFSTKNELDGSAFIFTIKINEDGGISVLFFLTMGRIY
jgi:hypothetical protein